MSDDSTPTTDGSTPRHGGHEATDTSATRRTVLKTVGASAVAAGLTAGLGTAAAEIPTPRLHTEGRFIKDPSGNTFRPRGFATAGVDFIGRGFYNYPLVPRAGTSKTSILEWATDESKGWQPNHIRLPITSDAMTSDTWDLQTIVDDYLRPAVDYLKARGVYALLDCHLIRPYNQQGIEESGDSYAMPTDQFMREFWGTVAPEFADDENVIYELFNEPTLPYSWGDPDSTWAPWKEAAQPWVDLIQEEAPATPVVIGSPGWTSVPDMAPEDPFEGDNLIYSGHIYPANGLPHEQMNNAGPFDETYGAPAEEVPIWITEFGWEPNGGSVDQGTTSGWGEPFREWVQGYENMGWSAWCFDDSWGPTFFESDGQGHGPNWQLKNGEDQMAGFVKQWLQDTSGNTVPSYSFSDSTPPSAPSNLSVERVSEISATVSWDAPTDEGEAGLSHAVLYVDGERQTLVYDGSTEATLSGLEPDSTQEVGVTAVDRARNESEMATVTVETLARDESQSSFADHALPGRIPAEEFDEGGPGVAYKDSDAADNGNGSRDTGVDVSETSGGDGYVGYVSQGEWLEYTVNVSQAGSYPVRISFAGTASPAATFRVEIDGETAVSGQGWNTGGWESFQDTRIGSVDLSAGEHIVRVVAETAGSNLNWIQFGEPSDTIDDTQAPTAPSNVTADGGAGTSVTVSWDAATDSGGSGLAQYAVSVGDQQTTVDAGSTEATVTGLEPATTYDVSVTAADTAGNQSSAATTVTTADVDATAPPAPTNVRVAEATAESVTVAWDPVTDDGSGVREYSVSIENSTWATTVEAGTTEATLQGLSPGTEYQVGVVAVDEAGNSSDRASVTAATSSTGSNQTVGVTLSVDEVAADGTAQASVTLDAAPDGVSGYDLTVSVSDTSVATIEDASYPGDWFQQGTDVASDGSSATLQAVDGNQNVQAGAENVELATLTLAAQSGGQTTVSVTVDSLDSDADGADIPFTTTADTLTVTQMTPIGDGVPQDLDGDGKYMDLNGNGEIDGDDVVMYFNNYDQPAITNHVEAYDYNESGGIDFDDIVTLFNEY